MHVIQHFMIAKTQELQVCKRKLAKCQAHDCGACTPCLHGACLHGAYM